MVGRPEILWNGDSDLEEKHTVDQEVHRKRIFKTRYKTDKKREDH